MSKLRVLDLLREKRNLEDKLKFINEAIQKVTWEVAEDFDEFASKEVIVDLEPWRKDILWEVADIIRTSPINPNYPYGYDCSVCQKAHIECTSDSGDGYECNWAYMTYLERELFNRGYYGTKTERLIDSDETDEKYG